MTKLMQHMLGRRDAKGHGGGVRGADLSRRSTQFEGRFGRMFRTLPAADFTDDDLRHLAHDGMTAEAESIDVGDRSVRSAMAENVVDDEENFGIPAGYTYFGQFIDHDLTFDPISSLQGQNDPDGLTDFRTPRFDLDSVYGRGPSDQPYMFGSDGKTFLLGRELSRNNAAGTPVSFDLPRAENHRAIIGDKRNDENVIVSQLHGLFLRLHNRIVREHPELPIDEVQRVVRWHYQWVILHDFLPRIVGREMLDDVLPHLAKKTDIFKDPPRLNFYHPREEAYIPVEFSIAAYRFGHSMVRPIYRLNTELGSKPEADDPAHTFGRHLIFASEGLAGLNGFRDFPDVWSIDWSLLFETDAKLSPENTTTRGPKRVQPSYKIDTSLVNPLDFLPEFCELKPGTQDLLIENDKPVARTDPLTHVPEIPNLALRNLLRGRSMGLPSGQAVARAMGIKPLDDEEILIGKATVDDTFSTDDGNTAPNNRSIDTFGASFQGNAPLWVYILAEAQRQWASTAKSILGSDPEQADAANATPVHLGPVGGRIVAETFVGLLLSDSYSYLSQDPNWQPFAEWFEDGFGMPQLVKAAMGGAEQRSNPSRSSCREEIAESRNALRNGVGATKPYEPTQPMRIQARPGSEAEQAYQSANLPGMPWPMPKAIAPGVNPDPLEDLIFHGGKVVPQMEFQNIFLGGRARWTDTDASSIDTAILHAMQHKGLNSVMRQYFPGKTLSCDKRDLLFFEDPSIATLDEPDIQRLVTALYDKSVIQKSGLETCIFNLVLPSGSILRLGKFTSLKGLGGYHGSLHLNRDGKTITLYYSANVYSERSAAGEENGIVAFNAPWKNVVATLYHELNEFRTDADVNDAVAQGDNDFLGWNSRSGKEVGDQPILRAGEAGNLNLVFKEIPAPPGKKIPVQFLYSNTAHGAEGPPAAQSPD